jgi:hypothetical protein
MVAIWAAKPLLVGHASRLVSRSHNKARADNVDAPRASSHG